MTRQQVAFKSDNRHRLPVRPVNTCIFFMKHTRFAYGRSPPLSMELRTPILQNKRRALDIAPGPEGVRLQSACLTV